MKLDFQGNLSKVTLPERSPAFEPSSKACDAAATRAAQPQQLAAGRRSACSYIGAEQRAARLAAWEHAEGRCSERKVTWKGPSFGRKGEFSGAEMGLGGRRGAVGLRLPVLEHRPWGAERPGGKRPAQAWLLTGRVLGGAC